MVNENTRYKPLDVWKQYETEKRKIAARNLMPEEYEVEIKELEERLKTWNSH
jgi:hypothetical protein